MIVAAEVACSSAAPGVPIPPPIGLTDTTLGPSDIFDVRVYGEQDLSGTYRVAEEGTIDFPFVGRVRVAGFAPPEIANVIRTRLMEGGFLVSPQVSVLVREYNSKRISVFGAVQRPGTFPFQERMNIVHGITLAGGFAAMANRDQTTVTRVLDGRERRFRVPVDQIGEGRAPNFVLRPGDIVFVPERIF